MLLSSQRSLLQAGMINEASLIILAIAMGLLFFVSICVVAPAVFRVLAAKGSVFHTFLEVPLPIIRALRARTQIKIAALSKAAEENELGLDIAGAGEVPLELDADLFGDAAAGSSGGDKSGSDKAGGTNSPRRARGDHGDDGEQDDEENAGGGGGGDGSGSASRGGGSVTGYDLESEASDGLQRALNTIINKQKATGSMAGRTSSQDSDEEAGSGGKKRR
jgi:hypothetical protein